MFPQLAKSSRIDKFQGSHRFLSNFWPASVSLDGIGYPSVEHAYQAAKTLDLQKREFFYRPMVTAAAAKKMGRKLFVRPDWESVKLGIMEDLVRQKFRNAILYKKLLDTVPADLVEGNTWHDNFWGDCTCFKHSFTPGLNHLGKILMKVRDEGNDSYT